MATADTARLIASLELQDKNFTRGLDKATRGIDRVDKKLGAFSGAINRNLGRALDAGISRGVRALTSGITGGLESLATLEDATNSVDGAISQMGKTGKVSAGQVATWANEIEADIGAAFDDKDIIQATTTLLRFGRVTSANVRPAMEVMTDLAAKTGDVESASTLLAKALADPTKAAGKLSRQGIILTKAQEKQIKAFVKAGKTGKAQAVVLDAVAKSTEGAAEASQGKYRRALSVLADVSEDAKRALAEGFLPVIERVADKLQTALADPKTMSAIRSFGSSLASGFDKAIDILEGVDWNAVGAGLKSAADWAGKIGSAFMGLPAEAKGIIIGLAGLTKLTGGAPIKIAVDFAKDAIGGVFGRFFDRGSSPANPLYVSQTGLGGAAGAAGGKGGASALVSGIGKVLLVGFVAEMAAQLDPVIVGFGQEIHKKLDLPDFKLPIPDQWPWGPKNTPTILPEIFGGNGLLGGSATPGSGVGTNFAGGRGGPAGGAKVIQDAIKDSKSGILQSQGTLDKSILNARDAINDNKAKVASAVSAGTLIAANAASGAGSRVTAQSIGNTGRIVGAIYGAQDIVSVKVDNYISSTGVTRSVTTTSRTSRTSSRTDDGGSTRIGGK